MRKQSQISNTSPGKTMPFTALYVQLSSVMLSIAPFNATEAAKGALVGLLCGRTALLLGNAVLLGGIIATRPLSQARARSRAPHQCSIILECIEAQDMAESSQGTCQPKNLKGGSMT